MARFAAIDVGSNALRLRIVEAHAPQSSPPSSATAPSASGPAPGSRPIGWREVSSQRAAVRLGNEVFLSGKLTPGSISQACEALRDFRLAMDAAKVDGYRATATSAVREAKNGSTLVERARREARVELDVIEGIEEARLIQLAVRRKLPLADRSALLVDVGGGSTEVTQLEKGSNGLSLSLPLGTVRLLDTYLRGSKTVDRFRETLLREAIDRALDSVLPQLESVTFDVVVGTGGNVETLCDLCSLKGGVPPFPRAIDVNAMKALYKRLAAMSTAERRDAYNLRPDRADTIVPAAAVFLRIASRLQQAAIVAPGVGLTAGILHELIDKFFHVWDTANEVENIVGACLRLGRKYEFDEPHGQKVAALALELFDQLQPLHAFTERDRLLLRAAGLLHDVGDFVRYEAHHKHSYYLIQHADIIGLSREERGIVANVARYHRKSSPDPAHPNFRELEKDARGKVRGLASILRIADALDREHKGKIAGIRAAIDRSAKRVTLFLRGHADRELEEWTVASKSDLFRDTFGLELVLASDPSN